MEIHEFTPTTVSSLTLPMQEIRLMPIGDIQYGAKGCDIDRLRRHIAWGVANKCYFIGLGDYVDRMSPSNRRKFKAAGFYDSVLEAMDAKAGQDLTELKDILRPTKGRWFGLINGHHFHEFGDGSTSTGRLAAYLGCPNLGDCAGVVLNLTDPDTGKVCKVKLWLHHGKGSSVMAGGALNTLERITGRFFAHVYLMGHQHTKPVVPIPFIDFDVVKGKPIFHSINRYLVVTGGFLKGYEIGTTDPDGNPSGSYIEQGMLTPVTLGGPLIRIRPRFRNGRAAPDISVEV